jgi:hypothetical protein
MRTSEQKDNGQSHSKQRLRAEISHQVAAFLHQGGRIEIVDKQSHAGNSMRMVHRPASAELSLLSSMLDE